MSEQDRRIQGGDPGEVHGGQPAVRMDTSGEGCWAVTEVTVPGTVEQVWESVSTGEGVARWFVPDRVEPRVGGAFVTHHGEFGESVGTITAWEPPHRMAYREEDWAGEGEEVPPWLTEVTLVAVDGDDSGADDDGAPSAVRVRLASGIESEGDRWGEAIAGTQDGWRGALRHLRQHHAHFPGMRVAQALVQRPVTSETDVLATVGVDRGDVRVGDPVTVAPPGAEHLRLSGTVVDLTEDALTLRVPGDGVWQVGAAHHGDTHLAVVWGYLYEPGDPDLSTPVPAALLERRAQRQAAWRAWVEETFRS